MNARPAEQAVLRLIGPPMERNDARISAAVSGKVVVITGASFGQGEATARLLARGGATVVIAARTLDRLSEIAAEIAADGGVVHTHRLDLCDAESVTAFAAEIEAEFGGVDVLVHNAGKSLRRSVFRSAIRVQDMDAMVGVNLLGPMRLTLALLPGMKERGGAHIVNVATAGLQMPNAPRWGLYIAAKAGFDRWIRSVAMETGPYGISVTSLYAGHIKSRMVKTGWVSAMPGHTPEQAARVVAYAITRRPRVLQPHGFSLLKVFSAAFEAPLEAALSAVDRRSGETPASDAAFAAAMARANTESIAAAASTTEVTH